MELEDFWAKTDPFQSIVTHGIVTGTLAQNLLRDFVSDGVRCLLCQLWDATEEEASCLIGYLVSLHDIGKIDYDFQRQDPVTEKRMRVSCLSPDLPGRHAIRHERIGAAALSGIWKEQKQDEDAIDVFSAIIGAHHQKDQSGIVHISPMFKSFQEAFEEKMRKTFYDTVPMRLPQITDDEGVMEAIVLGIMILADWIGSGLVFSHAEEWTESNCLDELIHIKAEQFLQKSGLNVGNWNPGKAFPAVWPWIERETMRPLQTAVESLTTTGDYSLLLLEAPMGEGKTEAGMFAAMQMKETFHRKGFYVALPTAATSNQMYARMEAWLQMHTIRESVRLLHGMAWLMDDASEAEYQSEDIQEIVNWLAPLRRGLLGAYAVGTIDQVMLAVTKAKFSVLRLLGLANKVLVIDEIHAYDVYMGSFLDLLLQWCREMQIPVVLLSATLPPDLKKRLLKPYTTQVLSQAYPLITAVRPDGQVTETKVERTSRTQKVYISMLPVLDQPEEIADYAAEMTSGGGCLCVLMNTVRHAQRVYQELKTKFNGDLLLFHAQFPAEQRKNIEEQCIQWFGKDKRYRPQKAILVATQVVEQSLDVDFDGMITAIAPVDLLIQRMGRIFRHAETIRPEQFQVPRQWILIPAGERFGADAFVYPEALLRQTIHILKDQNQVSIPEDIAQLVADGYDLAKVPEEECSKWLEQKVRENVQAGQARQYLINPPDRQLTAISHDFFLADGEADTALQVKTRLGDPTIRIALLEQELWDQIIPCMQEQDGRQIVPVKDRLLASRILGQSVSIRKARLQRNSADLLDIYGDRLIAGIRLFPAKNGRYEFTGGRIEFNKELGVIIEEVST